MKRLNFGCGEDYIYGQETDNVDIRGRVDIRFDFEKYPYPLEDNTYDLVKIDNVLEHMLYPLKVMSELHRVCKPGALVSIKVPYYNSGGAYNDPTHHHYYNRRTFTRMVELLDGKYRIHSIRLLPTELGKFVPGSIRERASFVFGCIIGAIEAELKAVK